MALSRTAHVSAINETPGGSTGPTTAAFTPPNDSLLVIAVGAMENNGVTDPSGDISITNSAGLSATRRTFVGSPNSFSLGVAIFTIPVVTGVSMTITGFFANSRPVAFMALSVVSYTGYDAANPIGTSQTFVQNSPAGGAESYTLPANPLASSEVFAALALDKEASDTTPGSSYSEIHDLQTGLYGGLQTQDRIGSTSTTVDYVDATGTGGAIFKVVGAAIEILEPATVSGGAPYISLPPPLLLELLGAVDLRYSPSVQASGGTVAETGNAGLGLWGTATVTKVATPSGRCAIGLAGTAAVAKISAPAGRSAIALAGIAAAAKVSPETGRSVAGLTGSGVARKLAPQSTTGSFGLSGAATVKKIATPVAISVAGLSGSGTGNKKSPQAGAAYIGFAPYGPSQGQRLQSGRCALGLFGRAVVGHVSNGLAGRSAIGLSGASVVKKIATGNGVGVVGLSGRGSEVKRATPVASALLGMTANGTAKHLAARNGVASLALSGRGATSARKPVAGRIVMGLCGFGTVYKPTAVEHAPGSTDLIVGMGPVRLRVASKAILLEDRIGSIRLNEANTSQ